VHRPNSTQVGVLLLLLLGDATMTMPQESKKILSHTHKRCK
jgi:hypothetical protein